MLTCVQVRHTERTDVTVRLVMSAFLLSSTNELHPHPPFQTLPVQPELIHSDQGQLITRDTLRLVEACPEIHVFLSPLTDSWQERACSRPAGSYRITEGERMVRTGGTAGIR